MPVFYVPANIPASEDGKYKLVRNFLHHNDVIISSSEHGTKVVKGVISWMRDGHYTVDSGGDEIQMAYGNLVRLWYRQDEEGRPIEGDLVAAVDVSSKEQITDGDVKGWWD